MIKLQFLIKEELNDVFHYIGDCVTGLNNEQFCNITGCYDGTDLSKLVIDAEENPIAYDQFKHLVPNFRLEGNLNDYIFSLFQGYIKSDSILIAYNSKTDIHYFFASF